MAQSNIGCGRRPAAVASASTAWQMPAPLPVQTATSRPVSRCNCSPIAGGMSRTAPSIRITSYGAPGGQPAASGPETRLTDGANSASDGARDGLQRRGLLERGDPGAAGGQQRGAVAGAGGDHQGALAGGDRRQLHQAGDDHRLHQHPALAQRHVLVGVGERGQVAAAGSARAAVGASRR